MMLTCNPALTYKSTRWPLQAGAGLPEGKGALINTHIIYFLNFYCFSSLYV